MHEKLDRRDFLLTLTGTASTLMLAGDVAFGQTKQIGLQTPAQGAKIVSGEWIELKALVRTQFPRLKRVDFRANGTLIGSGSWRDPSMTWMTDAVGPITISAEAISEQNNIVSTAAANVEVLGVMFDRMKFATVFNKHYQTVADHGADPSRYYDVGSVYVDNILTAGSLRRFEGLFTAHDTTSGQNLSLGDFTTNYLRVWREDGSNGFSHDPLSGGICNVQLGPPDFGAATPVGTTPDGINVYRAGWDNLNIPLPAANANSPLSLSIQFGITPGSSKRAGVIPFNSVDTTQAARSSPAGPRFYALPGIFAVRLTGY